MVPKPISAEAEECAITTSQDPPASLPSPSPMSCKTSQESDDSDNPDKTSDKWIYPGYTICYLKPSIDKRSNDTIQCDDYKEARVTSILPNDTLQLSNGDTLEGSVKVGRYGFFLHEGKLNEYQPISTYMLQYDSIKQPPQPPSTTKMAPIEPREMLRREGKPQAQILQDEYNRASEVTLECLYKCALKDGVHLLVPKAHGSKQGWINYAIKMFYGEKDDPGPLMAYEPWKGKEWQNKMKDLIEDTSKYFHHRYIERKKKYGEKYTQYTTRERLGHRIHVERKRALEAAKKQRDDAEKAKAEKKKEIKARTHDNKKKRKSPSPSAGSVPHEEIQHNESNEHSSGEDSDAKTGLTIRENLEAEKENAKIAAAGYEKVQEEDSEEEDDEPRENDKPGKKGKKNREHPTVADFKNYMDGVISGLVGCKERTGDLMKMGFDVLDSHQKVLESHRKVLEATNRTNSPGTSPTIVRTKQRREIKENEEVISVLKKRKMQMEEDNESKTEIDKVTARIDMYQHAIENLEEKLFSEC